jgi:hypothetical protein
VLAELAGRVAPERVRALLDALHRTTFPEPQQKTFVPGASVVAITRLPTTERIEIDSFEAMKLDGYRDVVRPLKQLVEALRTNNAVVLAEWQCELQQ